MQRRPYGTTGESLSVIGFGGMVSSAKWKRSMRPPAWWGIVVSR